MQPKPIRRILSWWSDLPENEKTLYIICSIHLAIFLILIIAIIRTNAKKSRAKAEAIRVQEQERERARIAAAKRARSATVRRTPEPAPPPKYIPDEYPSSDTGDDDDGSYYSLGDDARAEMGMGYEMGYDPDDP